MKYRIRVTEPNGFMRYVEFENVRLSVDTGGIYVYEVRASKIKAFYPHSYSIEVSEIEDIKVSGD